MLVSVRFLFCGICSTFLLLPVTVSYPLPENGVISVCWELDCVISTIKRLSELNQVIVSYVSFDFSRDHYSALYIGQTVDSFSLSELPVQYLLIESKTQPVSEMTLMLLSLLPKNSVFISLEEGPSAFGAFNLAYTRVKLGITHAPGVVLHLNHEQPWVTREVLEVNNKDYSDNYLINTQEDFKYIYSVLPVILRNYYYHPYSALSTYIPLGVPMFGYLIGNSSSVITAKMKAPSSERSTYCEFIGRTTYPKAILHEQAGERRELFLLSGSEGGVDNLHPCTVTTGNSYECHISIILILI